MKRKDLTGTRFGHLTVKEMLYGYRGRKTFCRCVCDCGSEKIIQVDNLKRGNQISCGCMTSYYRSLNNRTNEIGMKYNNLTIVDIDYSTNPSMAKCVCDCGNTTYVHKSDVVSGHTKSCGCLQSNKASESNTKDYTGIISESGVELISQSFKNDKGVWIWNCKCPICGNIFQALPAKVISNHTTSCGCKISSSKERIIEGYLKTIGVTYIREKRFPNCKYKHTLPFDFAVYNDNNELLLLIEYDGQQHFKPVPFYGGDSFLKETQIRDHIKTEYCNNNNIKLLRFNYLDDNKTILNTIINNIYP